MLIRLLLYFILIIITITHVINNNEEHFNQNIPFCINPMVSTLKKTYLFLFYLVVMQPHTIINQTLHSYCKEQFEFNIQPMYINLTA